MMIHIHKPIFKVIKVVFLMALPISFFYQASEVCATPLRQYIAPAIAERLVQGEYIKQSSMEPDKMLAFLPRNAAGASLKVSMETQKPDIAVETIFLVKRPKAIDLTWPMQQSELLTIYNVLTSISTLQGLEYYSASNKKMKLLYEISTLIRSPSDTTPVSDNSFDRLPYKTELLYARQKDGSFGDNIYKIELWNSDDAVFETSSNLTKMKYGIITVADPDDVYLYIITIPCDEGIIFYVVSSAKTAISPSLVRSKIETSFTNRAVAIFNWFSVKINSAW